MEFLKKNCAKLLIVVTALTSIILMLVPVFMASKIEFYGACQTIGIILFFVGMATFCFLRMSDKTKDLTKFVLVCTGVLVLVFMSLGLLGFNKDKDKAQGALGNAYAIFKSVSTDIEDGQEKIAGLTQLADGFGQAATTMGAAAAATQLSAFKLAGTSQAALVAGFVATGLGAETATVAQAATITATAKAIAASQLPENIEETKQDADAGALTVLFGYISMMLAFGLVPAIAGTKKLICSESK